CGEIKQLTRLTPEDLMTLLSRALTDEERGLGKQQIDISEDQLQIIAEGVNGDARKALNVLESVIIASDEENGIVMVEDWLVKNLIERSGLFGDKKGTHFYNLLSALQKSIRGDRKSTRLNSSHVSNSYAVFCLKK